MRFTISTYSKTIFLLLSVFCLVCLAGCGNNEAGTKSTKSSEKDEQSYTVKHVMGETTIPENPKRVVVLTNEGTEALLAMGVKPVGAVKSWLGNPWYDHIKDDMDGVEIVGTELEVNLEKIAALKPDLIIGNKVRQEAVYDKLSAIAPTVFSETLTGNWKENFSLYAKAINNEDKGNEVLQQFDQHIADVKEKLGDKVNQEVSVVRFLAGTSYIYYTDSFSGVIFDQLGFKRAEQQKTYLTLTISWVIFPCKSEKRLFLKWMEIFYSTSHMPQMEIKKQQILQKNGQVKLFGII